MTGHLLALGSWTSPAPISTRHKTRGVEFSLNGLVRLVCGVRGHATIRCSDGNHVSLRCMSCGHESAGWTLGRQAMREMPQPAARRSTRRLKVDSMSWGWLRQ